MLRERDLLDVTHTAVRDLSSPAYTYGFDTIR